MRKEPIALYDNGTHRCWMFNDLVEGDGVQANQFLIQNGNQSMLLDPGGDLLFMPLNFNLGKIINLRDIKYIFASHQDPDIIAALDRWMMHTDAKVMCSELWSRFLPHLAADFLKKNHGVSIFDRTITIPDRGMIHPLGDARLQILPAHFLHSEGNFCVYDPISKILFSGDIGASLTDNPNLVDNFSDHLPLITGFHRRYMTSGKVARYWCNMLRTLDIEAIVPQHGQRYQGKAMVNQFLDWFSNIECGVDIFTQQDYRALE